MTTSHDPPAITPDVRTAKSPRYKNSTKGHVQIISKEEATQQYKLYRSSPTSFPSYDRIKLIELPREYLPASLTTRHGSDATDTNFFWPALIYNNLVEAVRDLSPNAAPLLKAQLIVEYKKHPTRRVARLIGWNSGIDNGDEDSDDAAASADRKWGRSEDEKDIVLFAELQPELLRLSSSNTTTEMVDDETKNFCESLTEMEKIHCHLLQLAKEERKSRDDKKKTTTNAMKRFANRFGYALDMALNCLSRDVGSEPLLPRIYEQKHQMDEYYQEMMEHEDKNTNHVVCTTPNAIKATSDGDDNVEKHSPAEDSMASTAAVADGGDYYHNGVSEQLKPMQASTSSTGTKRTTKSKDQQRWSDESNCGVDEGKAMNKKTGRPATTSTATVTRGVAACEEDAIEATKKFSDVVSARSPKKRSTEEEGEENVGQHQQVVEEAASPIRSARKDTSAGPLSTPQDCRTRPQDPAIPLLSSPESCSSSSRYDVYEWRNLWPALERAGWRCIKAGKYNPLHNYYYVRPNCDPGDEDFVLGKHYFDSQDDVITLALRMMWS